MGTLRITNAQWTAIQNNADRPRVVRIFNRVHLGEPAPYNASGPTEPANATHWLFDDDRFTGSWRVRVAADGSLRFQEWDDLIGGSMIRELTLDQARDVFSKDNK